MCRGFVFVFVFGFGVFSRVWFFLYIRFFSSTKRELSRRRYRDRFAVFGVYIFEGFFFVRGVVEVLLFVFLFS